MIKKSILYFAGYTVYHAPKESSVSFINTAMRLGIADDRPKSDINGGVSLAVRQKNTKTFEKKLKAANIEYTVIKSVGFLRFIKKYAVRSGLVAGTLAAVIMLGVSSKYVWGFQITGNKNVSDSEVISILSDAGLRVGTKFSGIDFPQFQNDAILYTDKLAWISVNMSGTLAKVEVMEKKKGIVDQGNAECTNLIATEDGRVEYIEEVSGQVAVKLGDFVRTGDLLISGIRTDKNGNLTYERAKGRIKARVIRKFTVEVPKVSYEKSYTGRRKLSNSVNFFSKTINLLRNDGNLYDDYDIIENNRQIILFNTFYIPVFYSETSYNEFINVTRELSDEEMVSEAMLEYSKALTEAVGNGELLEKEINSYYENGKYVIECTLVCLDEITSSVEVPIEH